MSHNSCSQDSDNSTANNLRAESEDCMKFLLRQEERHKESLKEIEKKHAKQSKELACVSFDAGVVTGGLMFAGLFTLVSLASGR